MWAIISDIHANLEALDAVLGDIRAQGIQEIYCLGDLVGYGPNPCEVIDRAQEWTVSLMGNHDEAVLNEALGFNPLARQAVDWTRAQLKPGVLSSRQKKDRWDFLAALPLRHEMEDLLLVHGSPRDPTMEYILRSDCDELMGGLSPKIQEILQMIPHACFVGHTHEPGIITDTGQFLMPEDIGNRFDLSKVGQAIVNVGSVGQPRDGNPAACYVTVDGPAIQYHRVQYPFTTTQKKIQAIPALDHRIARRLEVGR